MTVKYASQTRERFLVDVVRQIPLDRLREVHLFQSIRQGGAESGVAVIAADQVPAESSPLDAARDTCVAQSPDDADVGRIDGGSASCLPEDAPRRYTIYMARYRLTLKGPDRGAWETEVVAEAEAPLLTVDAVVRGVQRRSGDVTDAERMSGDEVRMLVEAAFGGQ